MRILLTRHGQTDWNVEGKIQGKTDIELNETGIKQAEAIREKLLNEKIDVIISSPLKRARKTAEIIGIQRNIPIIIDSEIEERCFGEFEGKKVKEINLDGIWDYKLNKQCEGLECIQNLFRRIEKFLEKLKQKYDNKTVLLVTHKGVVVPIRVILEGISYEMENLIELGFGNCEVKEYNL